MLANLLIGIGYKAKQGKGVVSEGISDYCKKHGLLYETFSISEAIREHSIALGFLPADKPRESYTPEEVKVLVTEGNRMRALDVAHWVDIVEDKIFESDCAVACIDNVRFMTEINLVRGMRPRRIGYVVEVQRFAHGARYVSPDRDPKDATEVSLDGYLGWDFVLKSDRDPDWLKDQAWGMMRWICRKEGVE